MQYCRSADLVQAGDDEQLLLLLQRLPHVLSLALHLSRTVNLLLLTMSSGLGHIPLVLCLYTPVVSLYSDICVFSDCAPTWKGAANHSSKVSAESKTFGSRKLSSAHSSPSVFCTAVLHPSCTVAHVLAYYWLLLA